MDLRYLVSPISHLPLEPIAPDLLQEVDGPETFPVVEGIPILLPPGYIADWYDECLEIVFQERTVEIMRKIASRDYERWSRGLNKVLGKEYGRDGIRASIEKYSKLSREEQLRGFARIGKPGRESVPFISEDALRSRRRLSDMDYSQSHIDRMRQMMRSWAIHIPNYVTAVFESEPKVIVELGTGAGMGTNALIETGLRSARLITTDMDYACLGNAEGLAKCYCLEDQVDGIVASFWYMPFADNSIDVVCSHYGVDESRVTSRVIEEVARVLAPDGRFTAVVRSDGSFRLLRFLDQFGFRQEELREMAVRADIYPGTERLIEIAEGAGLALEKRQTITPEGSHERDILVFRKQ